VSTRPENTESTLRKQIFQRHNVQKGLGEVPMYGLVPRKEGPQKNSRKPEGREEGGEPRTDSLRETQKEGLRVKRSLQSRAEGEEIS